VPVIDEILNTPQPQVEKETPDTGVGMLDELVTGSNEIDNKAERSLTLAEGVNHDEEGRIYELSKKSGLPRATVKENPKKVESQVEFSGYTLLDPSKIAFYLGSKLAKGQPPNSMVSGDDRRGLENVQKSITTKVISSFKRGQESVVVGLLRSRQLFGDTSEATESTIQGIKERSGREARSTIRALIEAKEERFATQEEIEVELRKEEAALKPEGFVEEALTSAAEQIPILKETIAQSIPEALLGAEVGAAGAVIAGQLGPQVVIPEEVITVPATAMAGFVLGGKAGSAEFIFRLEAGLAADEFQEFRDENGQPLDPGIIWAASVAVGGVNAGLELASLSVVLKTIPGADKLLNKFTTKQVAGALKNPSTRKALLEVFKKYSKAVSFETLTEAAQEAFTILGGEIAKKANPGEFKEVTFKEGLERAMQAGKAAFGATVVLGLPGSAVGTYHAVNNTHSSNDFHDNLDKDQKAVSETKTAERSVDHAKEFLKVIGKEEDVYISAEGVDRLFQENTEEEAATILNKVGVNADKARATIPTGEDTVVSVRSVLTLNQEDYNLLKDDIKESPGAYTRREINDQVANEDIENTTKKLKEDIALIEEIDAEVRRLEGEISKAKLPDAKLKEDAPILLRGLADRLTLNGVLDLLQ
jgi:hypothetical protein